MTDKERKILSSQIINGLPPNPHGRFLLAPRFGKTALVISIIKRDKPKTILWVTPSAKLANNDIPLEFKKWGAENFLKKLTTITWMSLHKETGYYDLIVLDEEQFATFNNVENLLNKTLKYNNIVSMTGSPTEKQEKKDIYNILKLKILYNLNINKAVDIGILSNYSINVVSIDLSTIKNYKAGSKTKSFMTTEELNYKYLSNMVDKFMFTKYSKFRILNRMRAIKNSPSKHKVAKYLFDNLKGRKLFFCGNINQAESLSMHTYHSKTDDKDLQKFISGEIDEIAMVNAGGTGFTYKEIDHLVLVQADSNKNGLTLQKISRTLMKQKNYKATIWIVLLNGTQDAKWVESTLKSFDKNKINYLHFKDLRL